VNAWPYGLNTKAAADQVSTIPAAFQWPCVVTVLLVWVVALRFMQQCNTWQLRVLQVMAKPHDGSFAGYLG
jgi:hypothetical protein